jgi:alkanesulfonate monooxygenase SsuD/methylene tetrahydromethanopterin reductase-like flavin-dependent oxidoreductase (luciferase family)
VGLRTLPVQRPIPIWLGGDSSVALQRAGRIGDGVVLPARTLPTPEFGEAISMMRSAASTAGRDPDGVGIEPRLVVGVLDDDAIGALVRSWKALGASHLCIDTRFAGLEDMESHLRALRRVSAMRL